MLITDRDIDALVAENQSRYNEIYGPYDPWTGIGCYDFESRVCLEIPDFIIPKMYVPKECMRTLLYKNLQHYGTLKDVLIYVLRKDYDEDSPDTQKLRALLTFEIFKVRFREDPEFALFCTDKIEDKNTGDMIPFRLNYPQRRLIALFEKLRHEKKAIRVVILKARQWGGSTLTQLYIKWMQDFRHDGWNAIVLSQVKSTSKKIKAMYRKAVERQKGWTIGHPGVQLMLSPYENSPDDFIVTDGNKALRRSTLTVASFDNFDAVRGNNFHCAHYSEVAYWKKTPEHDPEGVISSISGGIHNIEDNIEVFESTGRGASGFFYDRCQLAMDPSNNDAYAFIFVPCFIIENDMEPVEDVRAFAEWLLRNKDRSTCPKGFAKRASSFGVCGKRELVSRLSTGIAISATSSRLMLSAPLRHLSTRRKLSAIPATLSLILTPSTTSVMAKSRSLSSLPTSSPLARSLTTPYATPRLPYATMARANLKFGACPTIRFCVFPTATLSASTSVASPLLPTTPL